MTKNMKNKLLTLYLKESPTGLKYLGITSRKNPYTYRGSGVYWKKHLKYHAFSINDIKTTILYQTYCKEELKEKGLYYSKLYNVVKSKDFANLCYESGECSTLGYIPTKETKNKYLPKISHKVKRVKDGKIFNSVNEAARDSKMYSSHLRHRLNLNDLTIGFEYIDQKLIEKAINNKNKLYTEQNLRKQKNIFKTSKYLGVSWNKEKNKWVSQIRINGKKKFLGYFNCANKASDAYQDKLKEIVTNKNK
jgi:hypothetical protein